MRDTQEHELSGATAEGVGYLNSAVRAFTLIYGDATGLYDAAVRASPKLAMAYLGKAWPLALANDPGMAVSARALLDAAGELRVDGRGRGHPAALSQSGVGHGA